MSASVIAHGTIEITPELNLDGFADSIKAAVADELRRIADELTPAPVEPPAPPRYVLVKDRTGDVGILDTELDTVADYGHKYGRAGWEEEDRELLAELDNLNSGALERRDLSRSWGSTFDPFTPIDR